MIIEVALFVSFVAIAGAILVKAYEWRQDVLYGPYIRQNDWKKQAPCPRSGPDRRSYRTKTMSVLIARR